MTKKELLVKLQSSEELVKIAFVPVAEVIKWVEELEADEMEKSQQFISDLTDSIVDSMNNVGLDLVEDYDLEMNYREVEMSSISFDDTRLKRIITDCITDL